MFITVPPYGFAWYPQAVQIMTYELQLCSLKSFALLLALLHDEARARQYAFKVVR